MVAAVELAGLRAGYGASKTVLHHLDVTIRRGALTAIIGPNGSGKSTLVRVIAGLITPAAGSVAWLGEPLPAARDARARIVALVPQRTELAFGFTARQIVAMGRAPHQGALMRERALDVEVVDRAMAACDLDGLRDRPIADLSGGEAQRVHVARALAQEPAILLLDEAAAHLDVRHATNLFQLLGAQLAQGLTCVAVMHDFNAALRYADDVLVLEGGVVAGHGPAREVLKAELLSRVFRVKIARAELPDGSPVLAVTDTQ